MILQREQIYFSHFCKRTGNFKNASGEFSPEGKNRGETIDFLVISHQSIAGFLKGMCCGETVELKLISIHKKGRPLQVAGL